MTDVGGHSNTKRALDGVRVVDLSTGVAGPMAAMFLADFGADVVKIESPNGDPGRSRPGFAMWNRNKRSVVVDHETIAGLTRLREMLIGADVCIHGGNEELWSPDTDPAVACAANPSLIYLSVPPFLGETPWYGGSESSALLNAISGLALRQNSFGGGPVDPAFSYVLYVQAIWAATACVAALYERENSGHGQHVTVGGVHGTMVSSTGAFVIDRTTPEVPHNYGPGGPNALYTRYQCGDGRWLFLATLISKFQRLALTTLGLEDILADERINNDIENILLPVNRVWVRQRFAEIFASRSSGEWLEILRNAGVPVGPLLQQGDWLDSAEISSIAMRAEMDDPERGKVVMPANPINLVSTPAIIEKPAPLLGEHTDQVLNWRPRSKPIQPAPVGSAPLGGIRILDLGAILAGPFAGTLLAELGAEVVKVEVLAGDDWRDRGMAFIRGQRGIAIDLQSNSGREAFYKMVCSSDLVLDNYRAGVLGRLGVEYEHLRQIKPDIISLSITAFGENSPFASDPAFDPLLQARSGMMTAQGGDDEPVLLTIPVNDVTAATLSALGAVVSLFHRRRSGEGQQVWLTLTGASALAQCEELIQFSGRPAPRIGGRDFPGPSPLARSYATSDGWIRLQALDSSAVARLQQAQLLPNGEPSNEVELTENLRTTFFCMTRDEAVCALTKAGIPAVRVQRISELADDQECERWEVFNVLEQGAGTRVLAPGRYARFSRSQHHTVLQPPGVGEHTSVVLAEAGFTDNEIDELIASGSVRQGSPIVYRSFAAYR